MPAVSFFDAEAHTINAMSAMSQKFKSMRVGAVSYLNAKPLIYGLRSMENVEVMLDVPSRLIDGLRDRRFDVALLPVIDYQRMEDLAVVPAGGIGSDGPTLTVRLFSRSPIEATQTLACDPDSHTSVALARVVLKRKFGIEPELIDLKAAAHRKNETRLLIGDKVITSAPAGFDHQLDLGGAWKELTGRPFVFAIWTAMRDASLGDLPRILARAREDGLAHVDQIVREQAPGLGWPLDIARKYLTEYLKFDIGQPQLEAIGLFHEYAAADGIIASPKKPLRVL